ncbi:N-acetylmuramoyl-L-alanine amidase [Chengkuizengella marina]|uniref:N-acetylmuramoyl-L-alanine amidase n=1 Tax=Chengkuizengella marina TaxID=2507566 RepID=A0A6N9Q0R6_9BACL|nr:N-acetylmuramoyl-L-alanine amidase [Chengkuizengella marina]NBI28333.1 hypothetical protein [Chengkuizengella marina]
MIKQDFIPKLNRNRPGYPMEPQGLLIHSTNNWKKSADAEMHAKYLKSGQNHVAGWHVTVDAEQAIQHIPFNENAWHAGDGSQGHYNRNWIGMETCTNLVTRNQKLDDPTYQNAVKTAAEIVKMFHFTRDQVQPHNVVKGKNCPWDKHFDRDQFREDVFKLVEGTPILSEPTATIRQAQEWAKGRGATRTFIDIAQLYWSIDPKSGVNPAIAYAQSAKETGFGRFGGVIDETYKNPCGMKTTSGGGNYDPEAHQRFKSWEEGITAHCDHLALYAGAEGYPKSDPPDPRHFSWIFGKAKTVEQLSGRWAPSETYGQSILEDYLKPLEQMEVDIMSRFSDLSDDRWSASAIEKVAEQGLMVGYNDGTFKPTEPVTREELAVILTRLKGGN